MNKSEPNKKIIITECPRDGIQGIKSFIPTDIKHDYINNLLSVGFDIIDVGSFVSPKSIPQLKDTYQVLDMLDISATKTSLMVLVANAKGAEIATNIDKVTYLSFPFSISPTFLKLNINSDFNSAISSIDKINNLCIINNKQLKVYLAMAFGNPYNDECNTDIILHWVDMLHKMDIKFITLSDVTGVSTITNISEAYSELISAFPTIEFGFHLHTKPDNWYDKLEAAYTNGCRSFDSVINGLGGCPMTNYEMLGNLSTQNLLSFLDKKEAVTSIDKIALNKVIDYKL